MNLTYKFTSDLALDEYESFTSKHEYASVYQSPNWAKLKDNWQRDYCGLYVNDILQAGCIILYRPLFYGHLLAYIPRGPVLDYKNTKILHLFLQCIKKHVADKKAFVLKVDLPLVKDKFTFDAVKSLQYDPEHETKKAKKVSDLWAEVYRLMLSEDFIHQGFYKDLHSTIQPRFNAVVESQKWRAKMPKGLKYYENYADKFSLKPDRLLSVISSEQEKNEAVNEFYQCIRSSEKKQGISLRSIQYFQKMFKVFAADKGESELFRIYLQPSLCLNIMDEQLSLLQERLNKQNYARENKLLQIKEDIESLQKRRHNLQDVLQKNNCSDLNNKICLAANVSLIYGNKAEMLYAGMQHDFASLYPQYKAYINCFDTLFAQGIESVNLGGISGYFDDGLSIFKSKFNPEIYEYIGEFDLILNKRKYKFYNFLLLSRSYVKNKLRRKSSCLKNIN